MHVLGGPTPSVAQRSSVRAFRRNSAASSSLVKNSERIASKPDMANSYASVYAHRNHIGGHQIPEEYLTKIRRDFPPYSVERRWAPTCCLLGARLRGSRTPVAHP